MEPLLAGIAGGLSDPAPAVRCSPKTVPPFEVLKASERPMHLPYRPRMIPKTDSSATGR